jgi:malic enzyme
LVTTGFRVKKEKQMNNIKVWLHGLAAAAISAFASAASGAIALPSVFTFDRNGFINMAKLATVPALLAVFAYLKSSPIPALNDR